MNKVFFNKRIEERNENVSFSSFIAFFNDNALFFSNSSCLSVGCPIVIVNAGVLFNSFNHSKSFPFLTHIDIYADRVGLSKDSVILLEQIRTLDKRRLREKMGHLDDEVMEEVNNAIAVSFGLHEGIRRGEDHTEERERESPKIAPGVYHNPVNPPSPAELPEWDERPNVAAATVHKEDGENRSKG